MDKDLEDILLKALPVRVIEDNRLVNLLRRQGIHTFWDIFYPSEFKDYPKSRHDYGRVAFEFFHDMHNMGIMTLARLIIESEDRIGRRPPWSDWLWEEETFTNLINLVDHIKSYRSTHDGRFPRYHKGLLGPARQGYNPQSN